MDLMRRCADMTNLALLFRLEQAFVQAGAVTWVVALLDVMQLVDVDVIGSQVRKRRLEVFPQRLGCRRHGLGGDEHLVAHLAEGGTQLRLAVAVGTRGVEIPHTAIVCLPQ